MMGARLLFAIQVLKPNPTSRAQAVPRLFDTLQEARIMFETRQVVLDLGQRNFLHSGFANVVSHDAASDLAAISENSAFAPEMS
jgi:hypothetical protein